METWVDPNSQPPVEAEENSAGIATNPSPPSIETATESPPVAPTPPAPKPVICKKGKCQPYDPAKDRVRSKISFLEFFLLHFWVENASPEYQMICK